MLCIVIVNFQPFLFLDSARVSLCNSDIKNSSHLCDPALTLTLHFQPVAAFPLPLTQLSSWLYPSVIRFEQQMDEAAMLTASAVSLR